MSLGMATYIELGSLINIYFLERSFALSMHNRVSAVKFIWSLKRWLPKCLYVTISQFTNALKFSTNFTFFYIGTFQKFMPVVNWAHSPFFIAENAYEKGVK